MTGEAAAGAAGGMSVRNRNPTSSPAWHQMQALLTAWKTRRGSGIDIDRKMSDGTIVPGSWLVRTRAMCSA